MGFQPVGEEGQRRLLKSRVVLAGCGALGSVSASLLVRAGVGMVRLIDRDVIQIHNLQRQMLYDEQDVRAGLPKVEAAFRKLRRINSDVRVEPCVADITLLNAMDLLNGFDLIIDATDNSETRYLINDLAVKTGTNWIFGAVAGSEGRTMTVVPGETPCLRCIFSDPPAPGSVPTAETAGIIAPVVATIASLQVTEALKLLMGLKDALRHGMLCIDVWQGSFRTVFAGGGVRNLDCPTCGRREFPFLDGGSR
jgi:adenylyltransferase/sulfurtransferase